MKNAFLARSPIVILILMAGASEAFGQARRGGMVGNRAPAGRPSFGGSPSFSGGARPGINQNINRPQINQNINRPQINQNINRPQINQNINRPQINNNINRPQINNNTVNRPQFNQNNVNVNKTNVNVNKTNVVNNITNVNTVNRSNNNFNRPGSGGGWGGYGGGYRPNPYQSYHSGWVNGSWNSHYGSNWGYGGYGGYRPYNYGGYGGYYGGNIGNSALGIGAGIGVAAWGLASLSNSWGYSRYSNPYYGSTTLVVQQPQVVASSFYDYSRPLDLTSPPPAENVITDAVAKLDTARAAFSAGDYPQALKLSDQALTETPNDPMLHEFRAICLFALGRYDEAAVPLYTVLSAGPGWDWTTLCGLYGDVETYTRQLRALESFCNSQPRAASARFVLASLYMTQGSNAAAVNRFREVVAIQPQDRLSAQLAAALSPDPSANPNATPAATPVVAGQPPADPSPAQAANTPQEPPLPTGPIPDSLSGTWSASPAKDVTISLAFDPEKKFTWKVTERGQTRELQGPAAFDNQTLALLAPDQPPMVATLTFKDGAHFHFKPVGAPADDPGLEFSK